jgi:hypothetical protein
MSYTIERMRQEYIKALVGRRGHRRRADPALGANASASGWVWGQAGDPMSRAPPRRHWRSYGNDPLPSGIEAMDEPFAAFPSWFMRVTCERCGQERMFNEAHSSQRTMRIRDIIEKMRHDGCGGMAEKVELLSGIEGVSSRPVRKIVLRDG